MFGTTLHARLEGDDEGAVDRVRRVLDQSDLDGELQVIRPSLEDAFLYLTTHDERLAEAT